MKRLTGAILIAGVATLGAQSARGQAYVGLTGGATVATMVGSLIERADVAYGAQVGLDVELVISTDWLIDVEFVFAQKGVSNVPDAGGQADFRLSYLEGPITVNRLFRIGGGRWSVSPYLGAAVGINRTCGIRFEGEFEYSSCGEGTLGGDARGLEVSVPLGVALRHRSPGGARIAFEVRFSLGLTTVLDAGGQSARNGVLAGIFSFALPLSREDQ